MGFKLKSGNKVDFKMMGSSPVRNMKDGDYSQSFEKSPMRKDDPSNEVDPFASDSFKGYDNNSSTIKNDEKENTDNSEQGTNVGKLPVPTITTVETGDNKSEENKIKTTDGSNLGDGLDDAKDAGERKKLMDQAKKEMYANAWQNSGIGHIVEAGKSIGRGIKNIRTKNKAKKAEKLASAQEAVGSGTETLKQAKTVDRNRKKTANKAKKKAKSDAKDKKKLAEYREKNPVRGKEAINAFANQTKKDKKLKDRYGTGADAAKKAGKTGDEPTGLEA